MRLLTVRAASLMLAIPENTTTPVRTVVEELKTTTVRDLAAVRLPSEFEAW